MIDEVLYMEARIFREFCSRFGFSSQRANGIFNAHKIWQYIESCYDLFHTCGDEYILNDIVSVLRRAGADLQPPKQLKDAILDRVMCADMILADAIEDMADEEGISRAEARDAILNSYAYEDLYNFDTRLWMEGPDYFREYYQKTKKAAG